MDCGLLPPRGSSYTFMNSSPSSESMVIGRYASGAGVARMRWSRYLDSEGSVGVRGRGVSGRS